MTERAVSDNQAAGDVADAARAAVLRGWGVIPLHTAHDGRCSCRRAECSSPGKHPRIRWQRFERERPSEDQVAAWWRRWPDANVGVVTGAVSGVLVLDVDPRHDGTASLALLESRWGPIAPTVADDTGSGGVHLWFHTADTLPSGPIAPGCDVKGDGGLVVIPPSLHASGVRYRWRPGCAPDERTLADPPSWLVGLARDTGHATTAAGAPGGREHPVRTEEERRTFSDEWAQAGVVLHPGDHNYLCPFHDDHHPSLHVDAEGCRWFCFGCGRGGGIAALRHELGDEGPARQWPRVRELPAFATTPITLPGAVEVDVVGESAHQDELLAITGGARRYGGVDARAVAELVPDPDAPLDEDAVAVRIGGALVGRLRYETAHRYRAVFADTARVHGVVSCAARIAGGWDRGHGDVGFFGVRLLLPGVMSDAGPSRS